MTEYKIIVDSSSNMKKEDFTEQDISFSVVPLSLFLDGKEYIDDGSMNVEEFLKESSLPDSKVSTACPAPGAYLKELDGAENYIIITLSSKVSGSYNSAYSAKTLSEHPENVIVLDSLGAGGSLEILVDKAVDYIHEGKSLSEIESALTADSKKDKLLFSLEKFDSLIKAGRVSKFIAMVAKMMRIRPLGFADNGSIGIKEKLHTLDGVLKRMVFHISAFLKTTKEKVCIISHTANEEAANKLKEKLLSLHLFKKVIVRKNLGLVSYYGSDKALLVSY